jgi:glucokinase
MRLGLDLSGTPARAVVLGADCGVVARGAHAAAGSSMAVAARETVLAALAGAGVPVTAAAIAVAQPQEGLPPEVEQFIREALPHAVPPPILVPAGVACVVAEQACGAAQGLTSVVALSVGDHVTSGIMLDGRVWPGAHGRAGSVGWLALNPVEREDYRRLGGLEAEVSAAGIVRRAVWRIKSGEASAIVQQHQGDLSRVTLDAVLQSARSGDGLCASVIRDTARYIGMALSNLAAIVDPEAVVLSGMIAASGDLLLEPIRLECHRRLGSAQAERLRIGLSTLADEAAAIGAARLAPGPA